MLDTNKLTEILNNIPDEKNDNSALIQICNSKNVNININESKTVIITIVCLVILSAIPFFIL